MTLRQSVIDFPQIVSGEDGTVGLRVGKTTFYPDGNELMFPTSSREEAVIFMARIWCWQNGINTFNELVRAPRATRDAFEAQTGVAVRYG